jgi:oxygen-dependent protoporphyrinogen oxidase
MNIGIVGAGPAGLTAAYLLKLAGHHPVVFEAEGHVGGRTATVRLAPGHHFDTGAGWLAGFYKETLGILGALGLEDQLCSIDLRSNGYLSERGKLYKVPTGLFSALSFSLIPLRERIRLLLWGAGLVMRHPRGDFATDLRFDEISAETHVAESVGDSAVPVVFEPLVSALYSGLSELSAASVRGFARALLFTRFYTLSDGMDSLWIRLAEEVEVHISCPVRRIHSGEGSGVDLVFDSDGSKRFDGCVVAAPITRVRQIVEGVDLPPWIDTVRYAPHVRVYGARAGSVKRAEIHPVDSSEDAVTVSRGADGWLWGSLPQDHAAALIGAGGQVAADLIDEPEEKVGKLLWERGAAIDPELFGIDRCHTVRVIKWPEAVPVFGPGHLTNLASWRQSLPVVFAGDWASMPCIEGAVRSGIAAARLFGRD